jgi:hypothetical protein
MHHRRAAGLAGRVSVNCQVIITRLESIISSKAVVAGGGCTVYPRRGEALQ